MALTGTVLTLLWVGSASAVPGVHAVELNDGQYIHGDKLGCIRAGESHECTIDLNGEKLFISVNGDFWGPGIVWVCDATFKGEPVECDPRSVTSSYQPHGVEITDPEVLAAAQADGQALGGLRTLSLGHSEKSVFLFAPIAGTAIGIIAPLAAAYIALGINLGSRRHVIRIDESPLSMIAVLIPTTTVILVFAVAILDYLD